MSNPLPRPSGPADAPAVHGDAQRLPVLASKITPPAARPSEVMRVAVCERACLAPQAGLVLFRAPAGYGKTTVLRQVRDGLAARGEATAWLTLDRADNDLSRFLQALDFALMPVLAAGDEDPSQDAARFAPRLIPAGA
jgi:LuxR family maltose regulon positive regulatory protein